MYLPPRLLEYPSINDHKNRQTDGEDDTDFWCDLGGSVHRPRVG